jgi:hypothetical protein
MPLLHNASMVRSEPGPGRCASQARSPGPPHRGRHPHARRRLLPCTRAATGMIRTQLLGLNANGEGSGVELKRDALRPEQLASDRHGERSEAGRPPVGVGRGRATAVAKRLHPASPPALPTAAEGCPAPRRPGSGAGWAHSVRTESRRASRLDALLTEYALGSREGVTLL